MKAYMSTDADKWARTGARYHVLLGDSEDEARRILADAEPDGEWHRIVPPTWCATGRDAAIDDLIADLSTVTADGGPLDQEAVAASRRAPGGIGILARNRAALAVIGGVS